MSPERAVLHVLNLQDPLPVRLSVLHIEVQPFTRAVLTTSEVQDLLDVLERKKQIVCVRSEEKELKAKLTDAGKLRLAEGE